MTSTTLFRRIFIIFVIGITHHSCVKDDLFDEQDSTSSTKSNAIPYGEILILGKQLENPYSIENMTKALNAVQGLQRYPSSKLSQFRIKPTHQYIKFILKDSMDLFKIEADTTLIAYDHPLDYEIIQNGDFYHDPEVPKDQPTPHYAAITVGQPLPDDIDYEVLSDLYLPDPKVLGENLADQLEDTAMALTGNLEDIEDDEEEDNDDKRETSRYLFKRRSKWRPAGRIQVWDDNIGATSYKKVFSHYETYDCSNGKGFDDGNGFDGPKQWYKPPELECQRAVYKYVRVHTKGSYVPIEGVKVRARRWFRTHTGITNARGYYSCNGRYRGKARYLIKWKRHEFSIRWSWLSSAKYRGPRKRGDWHLNIRGGHQEFYATIFRAAHHYYYKDIKGLKRPPQNYSWRTKLKINAKYKQNGKKNGEHCKDCRWFGIFSRINIYNPQRSSSEIYATTIHELAHASHWELRRNNWNDNNLSPKVKESWARGVEWELTRMKYTGYTPIYFGDYTGVVQDLIDGKSGYDQVSGYTIKQIEDVLSYTSSWNSWKNNIKNRYNNATKNNLDAVFNRW